MSRPPRGRGLSRMFGGGDSQRPAQAEAKPETTTAPSGPFGDWNPMFDDFKDKGFNSYDSGPGRDMQGRKEVGGYLGPQTVELYVRNIPLDLSEAHIKDLFSRAGNVTQVRIMNPKFDTGATYGFVHFEKLSEAYQAIDYFNNYKIGKFTLGVTVALSEAEKEKRRQEKQKVEDHVRYLDTNSQNYPRSGFIKCVEPVSNGVQKNENIFKKENTVEPENVTRKDDPKDDQRTVTRSKEKSRVPPNVNVTPKSKKPCTICGMLCTTRCPKCKIPYCSSACQKKDWSENNHAAVCKSRPSYEVELEERFDVDVDEDLFKAEIEKIYSEEKIGLKSETLPIGKQVEVVVSHIASQKEYFVIIRKNGSALDEMHETMEHFCNEAENAGSFTYVPEVEDYCIAKQPSDGRWYRARVLSSEDRRRFVVQFIDFGNEEIVGISDVRKLKRQFTEIPAQAIPSTSESGSRAVHEEMYFLAEAVRKEGKICVLKHVDRKPERPPSSDKVEIDTNSIKQEEKPHMRPPNPAPTVSPSNIVRLSRGGAYSTLSARNQDHDDNGIPDPRIDIVGAPTVGKMLPEGKIFLMEVIGMDSPSQFWINAIDVDFCQKIFELQKDINQLYDNMPADSSFKPNGHMLYAVKSEADNIWYRAQVYNVSHDYADVLLLDYATTERVHTFSRLHNLREFSIPFQAIQCNLEGVSPLKQYWSTSAKKAFSDYTLRRQLLAKVISKDRWHLSIEIILPNGSTLNEALVSRGVARKTADSSAAKNEEHFEPRGPPPRGSPPMPPRRSDPSLQPPEPRHEAMPQPPPSVISEDTKPSSALRSKTTLADLPQMKFSRTNEWIRVKIYEAASFSHLTLQILEDEPLQQLAEISEVTDQFHEDKSLSSGYTPCPGELICALYEEMWCRAEVTSLSGQTSAKVYFIDYGNSAEVASTGMMPLDPKLKKFACLGFWASIDGVSVGRWNPEKLLGGVFIEVKFSKCEGSKLNISEIRANKTHKDLLQAMLDDGVLIRGLVPENTSSPQPTPVVVDKAILSLENLGCGELVRGEPCKVVVTDARGPDCITIQRAEDVNLGNSLEKALSELYDNTSTPYLPRVGELVVARYSVTGDWSRGEVLEVRDKCRLILVDYGTIDDADAASIREFHPSLLKFRLLGIKCRLFKTGGLVNPSVWDSAVLENKGFICRAQSRKEGVYGVILHNLADEELIDTDACLSINEKLIQDRVLKSSTAAAPVAVPKPAKNTIVARNVPRVKLPSKSPRVLPCSVTGPHQIYVQAVVEEFVKQFTELEEKLYAGYPGAPPYRPEESEMVRVEYEFEGYNSWYRAAVLELKENSITALLVDYGNVTDIPYSKITALQEEHALVPRAAIHCSLWGMTEEENRWSGRAIVALEEGIKNKACVMTVDNDPESDVVYISEIQRLDDGCDVVKGLIEQNMVSRLETMGAKVDDLLQVKKERPILRMKELAEVDVKSEVEVQVSYIASLKKFYVNPKQKELTECWAGLQSYAVETLPAGYSPRDVGEVVLVLYEEIWCRAEVLKLAEDKKVLVNFFDFGNIELVPVGEILYLSPDLKFARNPKYAVQCSVPDTLIGSGAKGTFPAAAKSWFQQTYSGKNYVLQIYGEEVRPFRVDLFHKETGTLLSDILVQKGFATRNSLNPATPPQMPALQDYSSPQSNRKRFFINQLPAATFPEKGDVCIAEIVNPASMSVHMAKNEVRDGLERIGNRVRQHSCSTSYDIDPEIDELCIAKHTDGEFYRAVVRETKDSMYRVSYIDYGDEALVPITDLRPFPESLLTNAPYAHRIAISGIAPVGTEWSPETKNLLGYILNGVVIKYKKVSQRGPVHEVNLATDSIPDFAHLLIQKGLARSTVAVPEFSPSEEPMSNDGRVQELQREIERLKAMIAQ